MEQHQSYVKPHRNGTGPVPKIGIAGGAALGGGTLIVLARRRAKRRRQDRTPRKRVEAAAQRAASTAKDTASTVGSRFRDGVDRVREDRKLQAYAVVGAAVAWLYFKMAELRQLRRLSRAVAVGGQ